MKTNVNIAIDGPGGAGKSTVARALSQKLGYIYVDTGAMYRTIGLFAFENDIDPHNEPAIKARLSEIDLSIKWKDGTQHIFLGKRDVSGDIRTPTMSMYASAVSALPSVRDFLLETQRSFAKTNNVIMDGRDIGTVILPCAQVKIFMIANVEVRAKRRYEELCQKGSKVSYQEVLDDMIERDTNDSTRKTAPCVPAQDAVVLDTSLLSFEQVVEKCIEIINQKVGQV